jgi:hypothetical protein
MALARLALKSLEKRVPASASLLGSGGLQKQRFSAAAAGETKDHGKEVAVSEGDRKKKSKLFPRSQRRWRPWRNDDRDFVPALYGTLSVSPSLNFIHQINNLIFSFPLCLP